VADVEYNDDDGYDCHVLMAIDNNTDEDELVNHLYDDCGYVSVYVNEFTTVESDFDYDKFDVVEVLD